MPGEDGDNHSGFEDEREDPEKSSDAGNFNIMRHAKRKQQKSDVPIVKGKERTPEEIYDTSTKK